MMSSKRLFIAVDISDEARSLATEHIERLREHAKGIRVGWERPEKLHITLKFLGSVGDGLIGDIRDAIAAIAGSVSPFEIAISGTGVFPRARQPRVLWLGVEDRSGSMTEIASHLDARLLPLGFEAEKRGFSPHLTIARIREPQKAKGLADAHLQSRFEPVGWITNELVLYESQLKPTGSVYSVVSRHPL